MAGSLRRRADDEQLSVMSATAALEHWDGVTAPVSYMSEDLIPEGGQRSFPTVAVGPNRRRPPVERGSDLGHRWL